MASRRGSGRAKFMRSSCKLEPGEKGMKCRDILWLEEDDMKSCNNLFFDCAKGNSFKSFLRSLPNLSIYDKLIVCNLNGTGKRQKGISKSTGCHLMKL